MYDHPAVQLATDQHGAVARHQLRRLGLTYREIDQLAASRHWVTRSTEVLVRTGAPLTTEQRLMVALLDAGSGAFLSHLTGGRRWGLGGCRLWPVQVVRSGSSRRRSELAEVHRVREIPARWTTRLHGLPIVRPELVSLHLFAVCSFGRAERLTDRLWSSRLLSGPSLQAFVDELGRSGRNGTLGVRQYLERRPPDYVPPASGLESRFMELMAGAGIAMRRQVDSGGERWTGRVDFRHRDLPVVVEIQSEAFHTALCDQEHDARRVARLREDGFHVVEITDDLVWAAPREVVRRVRAALAGVRGERPEPVL